MWQRKSLLYLLLAGGGATFLAVGLSATLNCNDYLTGQLEEPSGPLQITKLTLFDPSSRDAPVFTDTSIPDCSKNQGVDCTTPDNRDTVVCRVCYNDVAKDKYTPSKSVPTPDSDTDIRVVFNKLPLLFNGDDIAKPDNLAKAITMSCSGCGGLPPLKPVLQITGSGVTFDPTQIPYGPALQLTVDKTDPRSALEPDTSYQVKIDPAVAGRDGEKVDLQVPPSLLTFKTEPFRILQAGIGDAKADPWVYSGTANGDGTSDKPYHFADLVQNGAVALKFNASLYTAALSGVTIKGVIDAGAATVDVQLGANNCKLSGGKYVPDNARVLYLIPATVDRQWPLTANQITVVIPASAVKDVAQTMGFPVGRHGFGSDLVVAIKLKHALGDSSYTGVTTDAARAATDCKAVGTMNPDMSGGTMDMAAPRDM